MLEEQDTCRICSGPAEPDQPLFYPCKCSGTIRYIHQECLNTWLVHSKKKTCDVCKHPYSFTKVYAPNMPARLPLGLLLQQLSRQAISTTIFALRAVVVALIWLAFLPWVTIWTWRMYFVMGESTAWWISNRPHPQPDVDIINLFPTNVTMLANTTAAITATPSPSNSTASVSSIFSNPTLRSASADIVAGQIIASLIVLAFVAVFLLREWIAQNARPGIFEDAEEQVHVHDEVPLPQELVLPPAELPVPVPQEEIPEGTVLRRQLDEVLQQDAKGKHRERRDPEDARRRSRERGRRKGKRKADTLSPVRLELRKPPHWSSESADEQPRMTWGHRDTTRQARQWRKDATQTDLGFGQNRTVPQEDEEKRMSFPDEWERTQFTFRAPPLPSNVEGTTQLAQEKLRQPDTASPSSSPFPFDDPSATTSPPHSDSITKTVRRSSFDTRYPSARRPPLPSITLPGTPSPSGSIKIRSSTHSPLASPRLATYRAPEELDAGPSWLEYFSGEDDPVGKYGEVDEREDDMDQEAEDISRLPVRVRRRIYPRNRYAMEQGDADDEDEDDDEDDRQSEWVHLRDGELGEEEVKELMAGDASVTAQADDEMPLLEPASDDEDEEDDEDGEGDIPDPEDAEDVPEQDAVGLNEGEEPQDALPPNAPPELNEDLDINMEDDMDGALEAIGLRGPVYIVLQNAALMIFILDTAIAVCVCVPYTVGKSAALLSLEPRRFMQIIHLPIRGMRIATDPVVDSVLFLLSRVVLPPIIRAIEATLNVLVLALATCFGSVRADQGIAISASLYLHATDTTTALWHRAIALVSPSPIHTSDTSMSLLDRLATTDSPLLRIAEPYFAPIGSKVRIVTEDTRTTWIRLAIANGPREKMFAISLGYVVVTLLLAIYMNILNVGSVRNAGRALRSAVRQQLLVVKVAVFIIIELVVFPLGCGIMLDVCTVSLFPQGNFRSRTAFLLFAPITATFYHWVVGTMFMYQFAMLLGGCRSIMRPGSMWFIKDPQDQNFHPIRDILERPTFLQMKKLLLSAFMYGLVVACGVATISGMLRIFSQTIMPFRWKIREPLSGVPIDLLFLHLVLPYTMHYFRPKEPLRRMGASIWKFLSAQLRLTSYMFGERHITEEFTPKHWTWPSLSSNTDVEMADAEVVHDGSFRRVPNNDNVVLVKDARATVMVDMDGIPINEQEAALMKIQDLETLKAKRVIKDDYTVVYIPPHFKYRVTMFIVCIWIFGSVFLSAALAIPILLGRGFFNLLVPHEVHDGYSFLAGFYLLWGCWLVGDALDRMDKRRQRHIGEESRAYWPLYVAKRSLLWMAQASFMAFFLGFIIPTLIALVVECYVILPVRHLLNPAMAPRIRIIDMWALGLIYTKILLKGRRVQTRTSISRGIDRIKRNGWTKPDPLQATREVILPLTIGLLGMLLLPPMVIWGLRRFLSLPLDDKFLFLHVYPGIFSIAGFGHAAHSLSGVVASWSQGIRDKEFLLEMRLRNLESEAEQEKEKRVEIEDEEE